MHAGDWSFFKALVQIRRTLVIPGFRSPLPPRHLHGEELESKWLITLPPEHYCIIIIIIMAFFGGKVNGTRTTGVLARVPEVKSVCQVQPALYPVGMANQVTFLIADAPVTAAREGRRICMPTKGQKLPQLELSMEFAGGYKEKFRFGENNSILRKDPANSQKTFENLRKQFPEESDLNHRTKKRWGGTLTNCHIFIWTLKE